METSPSLFMSILSHPVAAMVLMLGILVFVHELGHYLVGRMCGIGVEIFSIGFGPRLLGVRIGPTDYRIGLIPLGGYVKFFGTDPHEDVPPSMRAKALNLASPMRRALTYIAGPLANFVLAFAVYVYLGAMGLEFPAGVIGTVRTGSPAERAGLLPGDEVISIDGAPIKKWSDLQENISQVDKTSLQIRILRDGVPLSFTVEPEIMEVKDMFERPKKVSRVGVGYGYMPPQISVAIGSLAEQAGLRNGDVITTVTGKGCEAAGIGHFAALLSALRKCSALGLSQVSYQGMRGDQAISGEIPLSHTEPERLMQALGISSGQLLISDPKDTLFLKNDQLVKLGDQVIRDIYDLQQLLESQGQEKMTFTVRRDQSEVTLEVTMKALDIQKATGRAVMFMLPVAFYSAPIPGPMIQEVYRNPIDLMAFGLKTIGFQSKEIVTTLYGLVTGEVPMKVLGGPILVAKVASESVKQGLQTFFISLAMISINLGLVNMLPIPVLDGGQLLMVLGEMVARKPLSEQVLEQFHKFGFIVVLSLIVLATYNDLSRFWIDIISQITGARG